MTSTVERRYQMTRLRAGDYVLPSNDGRKLLRITSYEEDGSAAWIDSNGGEHPVRGTFWSHAVYLLPMDGTLSVEWEDWQELACGFRTRAAAVVDALRTAAAQREP